jgi:hypothetical protein
VTGRWNSDLDDAPISAGLSFDPSRFESGLTWILGSPRSGSTWLLRLLVYPWRLDSRSNLSRSDVGFHGGGPFGRKTGPAVVPIDESYFPRHLTPFLPVTGAGGNDRDPGDYLFNTQNEKYVSYCFSDAYEDVWRPELRRLILVRLHAQVARAAERFGLDSPRVVIKEPNGSYGAEFLMGLLPRARMIFLLRDGRDVLDSQLALRTRFGAVRRGMSVVRTDSERLSFVRTHANLWVNNMTAVDRAYAAHDPELRMRVRYEDLRADTFNTLAPVTKWLGDERTDEELRRAVEDNAFESTPRLKRGKGRMRRAATPGLWRQNLGPDEQRLANEIMGDTLVRLGYDV